MTDSWVIQKKSWIHKKTPCTYLSQGITGGSWFRCRHNTNRAIVRCALICEKCTIQFSEKQRIFKFFDDAICAAVVDRILDRISLWDKTISKVLAMGTYCHVSKTILWQGVSSGSVSVSNRGWPNDLWMLEGSGNRSFVFHLSKEI